MPNIRRAERHTAKSNQYFAEAESALREAHSFGVSGEPDKNGNYHGDNVNGRRMMDLHFKLVEKGQKHARKALDALELP